MCITSMKAGGTSLSHNKQQDYCGGRQCNIFAGFLLDRFSQLAIIIQMHNMAQNFWFYFTPGVEAGNFELNNID